MALPFVFLDRDGTLNIDSGYLNSPEKIHLIEGAAEAVSVLRSLGFGVLVVSNQSAVGRGMATEEQIEACNQEVQRKLLAVDGKAKIDRFFFCPHHPTDGCNCRKPKIGMLENFLRDTDISIEHSWIIGDKLSDLEFGANLGIPSSARLLVMTGEGERESQHGERLASLGRAVQNVLSGAELIRNEASLGKV